MKRKLAWLLSLCLLVSSLGAFPAVLAEDEETPAIDENASVVAELTADEETPADPQEEATAAPAEATEEPVEATEEPIEETEDPVEATEEPAEATEEPAEETEEPIEETEEPIEETEEPVEETEDEAFVPGYYSLRKGAALYENRALTKVAGKLDEAAVVYATALADDVLTVSYYDGEALKTAYIRAASAEIMDDQAVEAWLDRAEDAVTLGGQAYVAVAFETEETEEPVEETEEPVEETEEPVEETEEPVEETEEPVEETEEPVEETEEPVEETEEPVEETEIAVELADGLEEEFEIELPDDEDPQVADLTDEEYLAVNFDMDATKIIRYKGTGSVVVIPSDPSLVDEIGEFAFTEQTGVTAITIPAGVKIGSGAFNLCTNLVSVALPSDLTEIPQQCFSGCTSLSSISIPDTVTEIKDRAFENCTALSGVSLPSGVTKIGDHAFAYCTKLNTLVIPTSVTEIGDHAFHGCTSLTECDLSGLASLTTIGDYAFATCTGITSLRLPDSGALTEIGSYAFNGDTGITLVDIPNTVTKVGAYAFENIGPNATFRVGNDTALLQAHALGTSGNVYGGQNAKDYAALWPSMTYCGNLETYDFINQCYLQMLNRVGEPSGVFEWSVQLANGSKTAITLVDAIASSAEFTNRGLTNEQIVDAIAKAMFGPSFTLPTATQDELVHCLEVGMSVHKVVHALRYDTTITPKTFETLCEEDYLVEAGDIELTEWRDQNLDVTAFAYRAYENILNRKPDSEGLNYWCERLIKKTVSGAGLVDGFISSAEFTSKNYTDREVIRLMYKVLMDFRVPGTAEEDYWANFLDKGFTYHRLVEDMAHSSSNEFQNLCDSYGIDVGHVSLTVSRDMNEELTMFVRRCLMYILGRTSVSTDELDDWTGKLYSHKISAGEFLRTLLTTTEFKSRPLGNDEITVALYRGIFGNSADDNFTGDTYTNHLTSAEKDTCVKVLNSGCTVLYLGRMIAAGPNDIAACNALGLGATHTAFVDLCSTMSAYPGVVTVSEARDQNYLYTAFVTRCYQVVLGRNPDLKGLNDWCAQLNNKRRTAYQVANEFLFSEESLGWHRTDVQFVNVLYNLYMDRDPEDSSAVTYWCNVIAGGATRQQVSAEFANSDEFAAILAAYGLK